MLRNPFKNPVFLSFLLLALVAVFVAFDSPASAHNALIYTDKVTAAVGEEVEVGTSTSEPFGNPDMPFYANEKIEYVYGPVAIVAFEDDKATELDASICGSNDGTRKTLSYDEIEAAFLELKKANPDAPAWSLMTKVFNSNIAKHKIGTSGTTTLVGHSTYGKGTVVKNLMKTFVNLSPDGESTKLRGPHFGFDGIELRPVEDLANVRAGGTVKVEVLLNGKPQSGVIVYCGAKDLPESERIASVSTYTQSKDPIYSAAISDRFGIVTLDLPNFPSGANELRDVYLFSDGHMTIAPEKVRYRSSINFSINAK